jgi:hypothetical protein
VTWLDDNLPWLKRARKRYEPRHPEPLMLRVWFSAPVAWDPYDGTCLEGALQHAVVLREIGQMPADVFSECPADVTADIQIPIVDEMICGRPIARASWGFPAEFAAETVRWRRHRTRVEQLPTPGGRGTIVIAGGPYKNTQIPTATIATPWLDFYVRGDRALLADLLRDVGAVGRCRAGGLGAVLGTEILPDPEDRSLTWRGRPMRSIPVESEDAAARFEPGSCDCRPQTTRAPYWAQRSKTLCVVPIWRV